MNNLLLKILKIIMRVSFCFGFVQYCFFWITYKKFFRLKIFFFFKLNRMKSLFFRPVYFSFNKRRKKKMFWDLLIPKIKIVFRKNVCKTIFLHDNLNTTLNKPIRNLVKKIYKLFLCNRIVLNQKIMILKLIFFLFCWRTKVFAIFFFFFH